jgi:hypothetical protein
VKGCVVSKAGGSETNVGVTVQPCPQSRQPVDDKETVRIRVSLFYDGTGNNRTNVGLGPAHSDDDSYKASKSNIALLESVGLSGPGPDVDHHFTVYTEGIGTVDAESDSNYALGLGTGDFGIEAKVERGLDEATKRIISHAAGREIIHLHIDTFGFSRGAAAARYCVWVCLNQPGKTMKNRIQARGGVVGQVEVKFVGLFDTVASHGLVHSNDTADLHLDAISAAGKVIQLAAAEEHRANFRLTNIASAGAKGTEFFLPGVHSDIGGGYMPFEDENEWLLLVYYNGEGTTEIMQREIDWMTAAGWYRADELSKVSGNGQLKGNRKGIGNLYSRIPLRLMADFGRETGVHFQSVIEDDHGIPPDNPTLQAANQAIVTMVKLGGGKTPGMWFTVNPASDPSWHKQLRHNQLHFSARYNTTYGVATNAPDWSTGGTYSSRRKRTIQNG